MFAKDISVRIMKRLLQNAAHLGWRQSKRAPKLAPNHIVARKKWSSDVLAQDVA